MQYLILLQLLITLGAALVLGYWQGDDAINAALYGGGIAIVNTMLLAWGVSNSNQYSDQNIKASVIPLYISAALRFFFTLIAMAVGMGYFKIHPIFMLIVFGLAYIGYVFAARRSTTR